MRFFYDTEFIDNGRTIELISIGVAAEILPAHGIPELEAHVQATIGEPGDAACDQGIGTARPPVGHVRSRGLVHGHAARVDAAELAAALEVGPHDGRDLLGPPGLAAELGDRDGELRGSDARDVDTELGQGSARCQGRRDAQEGTPGPRAG